MTVKRLLCPAGWRAVVVFPCLAFCCSVVSAQTNDTQPDGGPWWVRAGAAWVAFDENAELQAGGQSLPGANANVKNNAAFLAEFGYRFTPNISLGLTIGYPPTTTMTGTGSVAGVGTIGRVKYGPAALTLQYQFTSLARYNIYPYVGAGVTYLKIFDTTDGSVTSFQARNAWGGGGSGGV